MKSWLPFLFVFLACSPSIAQETQLINKIEHLRMIGMTNLKSKGVLFISTEKKWKHEITLHLLDSTGVLRWTIELPLLPNKKKYQNKCWVGTNENYVLWLRQTNGWLHFAKIRLSDGKIIQPETRWMAWPDEKILPDFHPTENGLIYPEIMEEGAVMMNRYFPDSSGNLRDSYHIWQTFDSTSLLNLPIGFSDNSFFHCRYSLSRSHQNLELNLEKINFNGDIIKDSSYYFDIKQQAFAYNGLNDPHVMYSVLENDKITLIGKLDANIEPEYHARSEFEGYSGFWIARFNSQLQLMYFKYHDFRNYKNVISSGLIKRPIFTDLKEDERANLYIQYAEIPDALSYNSYLFELNPSGDVEIVTGGMSEYNFYQANHKGIHHIVSKSKMRLVNDDWRYYANNFLDEIKPNKSNPSNIIAAIYKLSRKSGFTHDQRIYNFTFYQDSSALIFEYIFVKGGRMNVYRLSNN